MKEAGKSVSDWTAYVGASLRPLQQRNSLLIDIRWMRDAACKTADPDLPFGDDKDPDEQYTTKDARTFAQDYCMSCPVLRECFAYSKEAQTTHGVFGGRMRRGETY